MAHSGRNLLAVWLIAGAALCMAIGLLGALGPALAWFLAALVLDLLALVLFMSRRR